MLEVADNTTELDLGEKAQMYARHAVTDYWVLDLVRRVIVIHRQPGANGYASMTTLVSGESISPLAFPDITFTIDEFLG